MCIVTSNDAALGTGAFSAHSIFGALACCSFPLANLLWIGTPRSNSSSDEGTHHHSSTARRYTGLVIFLDVHSGGTDGYSPHASGNNSMRRTQFRQICLNVCAWVSCVPQMARMGLDEELWEAAECNEIAKVLDILQVIVSCSLNSVMRMASTEAA